MDGRGEVSEAPSFGGLGKFCQCLLSFSVVERITFLKVTMYQWEIPA
jgi:hypothetical protein